MRIRSELFLIVLQALYDVSTASDGAAPSKTDPHNANLCYWTSAARGRIHYSFLRESAATQANALRLYLSTWTEDQRLVDCVIVDESAVAESYLSLCHEKRAGNFLASPEERFNISLLLEPGNPCVVGSVQGFEPSGRVKRDLQPADPGRSSLSSPTVSTAPEVRRRKRSWIFPGTLWCGTGTKANAYDDIGLFENTDRCCREHDHCKNTIPSFRVNYGVFNHNLFTVSHCDCDRRFRQCLQEVNNTIAHMVGYSFFSVLKVPCFVFTQKKHCTQFNWWGLCKSVEVAPYAVFHYPSPYNSTQLVQVDEGSEVTAVPESPAVTSSSAPRPAGTGRRNGTAPAGGAEPCRPRGRGRKTSKARGRCGPRGPARGDTFRANRKPGRGGKGRKGGAKPPTAAAVPRTATSATTSTTTTTTTTTTTHPTTTTKSTTTTTRPTTTSTTTRPTTTSTTTRPTTTSTTTRQAVGKNSGKSRGPKKRPGDSKNALPTDPPRAPAKQANSNLPAPVESSRHKDKLQLCDCYKQLDECEHKILPYEEKYGLRNMEPKILYHCACTRGLSHQLRQLNESGILQSLLLDFVSLSCFKGLHLEDCLRRPRCRVVLSESKHLKETLRRLGVSEVTGGPVGSTPKVKRQNTRKARGKSSPVRLYKRCLRMTSKSMT